VNQASPVAYSGEPGAFAEDAVIAFYGAGVDREGLPGFREVFRAVTEGRATSGVVPVENLVNGSVFEILDLLLEFDPRITGEVVVPIELCLAARSGSTVGDVERVYSHIQALGQAERYLRAKPWLLLTTYNTAGAGRLVAAAPDEKAGAVLSRRAALEYGLDVLADRIQDEPDNRTRFLVIEAREGEGSGDRGTATPGAPHPVPDPDSTWRTTIAFAVENEPGSLLRALAVFADREINLSKLESRPSRAAAWEYVFWADLDVYGGAPGCVAALGDLAAVATMVRMLGTYPRASS